MPGAPPKGSSLDVLPSCSLMLLLPLLMLQVMMGLLIPAIYLVLQALLALTAAMVMLHLSLMVVMKPCGLIKFKGGLLMLPMHLRFPPSMIFSMTLLLLIIVTSMALLRLGHLPQVV